MYTLHLPNACEPVACSCSLSLNTYFYIRPCADATTTSSSLTRIEYCKVSFPDVSTLGLLDPIILKFVCLAGERRNTDTVCKKIVFSSIQTCPKTMLHPSAYFSSPPLVVYSMTPLIYAKSTHLVGISLMASRHGRCI